MNIFVQFIFQVLNLLFQLLNFFPKLVLFKNLILNFGMQNLINYFKNLILSIVFFRFFKHFILEAPDLFWGFDSGSQIQILDQPFEILNHVS